MAAGLGFKTFSSGDILTASDVNGYLMQGVLVFASEAARNAAITSPEEGQFAYTKDNNSLWYYTGSAWAASGATGDIEGVTAGTGISGGGTSGTVTITNSMATAIDAKGDLIGGTGADTFARLAVGANGTVLTADSAETTGLKWAAPAAGGKVLQVISASTTTATNIATTTYTDSTITATITPTSATSKILVIVSAAMYVYRATETTSTADIRLMRDATAIQTNTTALKVGGSGSGAAAVDAAVINSLTYLDSPATTSAVTYKIQGKVAVTTNSASLDFQLNSVPSNITLLEIGA